MDKKEILIIIPTYNESGNIELLIKSLFSLDDISILVGDDNSPDGTSQQVERLQKIYPQLFLIRRKHRMGMGNAYVEGFKHALEGDYQIIIQMDADLSHDPGYIKEMFGLLSGCSLVLGSKYIKGGGSIQLAVYQDFVEPVS